MSQHKPIRVFLSHATQDREMARELSQRLRSWTGVSVHTPEDISVGQAWSRRILDRIKKSDLMMVLLTPDSVRSPWILQEMGAAWGLDKKIAVVSTDAELASGLPFSLDKIQILKIEDLSDPEIVSSLVQELSGRAQAVVAEG